MRRSVAVVVAVLVLGAASAVWANNGTAVSIEHLVLVDADKYAFNLDDPADLFALEDGAILALEDLPTNLNIRALTNPDLVGSVLFSLDGAEVGFRSDSRRAVENFPPYSAGGDSPIGHYLDLTLTPGRHTIEATPYSRQGATGRAGETLSVTFTVGDTVVDGGGLLAQAVEAIGGEEALMGLERFAITSTGATSFDHETSQPNELIETSTYAKNYTFDLADGQLRVDIERTLLFEAFQFFPPQSLSVVLGGMADSAGGSGPGGNIPSQGVASLRKQQRLFNPHFILREGLSRPELTGDGGTVDFDGRSHRILTFADDVAEIRLFVDADTGLISKLETIENHILVRDVSLEVLYQDWQVQGSLVFPNRVELYVGGALVQEETRSSIELEPSLPDDFFDLPPDTESPIPDAATAAFGEQTHHVMEAFFNAGFGYILEPEPALAPPVELAPGVTLLASGANTLVVSQDEGLVVLEAPFNPAHGTNIVTAVSQLSADPITHVVQSHHHMDHASGVRSLVAAGATAVVGNGVGDFWNDVLSAESSIRPDALAAAGVTGVVEELELDGSFVIEDDDITTTAYHISANPHADGMLITTIETGSETFVYEADLYNAGTGFTLVIGGPESFFAALRDLGIIDQTCSSALPLTIVPAHGVPQTLQDSLAELAGLGVDVGC